MSAGDPRGYDYEKVKSQVHKDAVNPAIMIILFIVVSFIVSTCCVILICMLVSDEDVFGPDRNS